MAPKQKPGKSKQDYGTPPEFLIAVRRFLGIDEFACDLAASPENAVCPVYLIKEDDSLSPLVSWVYPDWCWLNYEFGKAEQWMRKAAEQREQGACIAVLCPASIGANWWAEYVVGHARIIPLEGRITFVGETDPYPKDCALLLYAPVGEVGYAPPWKWMDTLTDEEKTMAKKRTAKPEKKPKAKARAAKSASRPKVRQMADAPKKRRRPRKDAAPVSGTVTTFRPNGREQVQPAPAAETTMNLGPIILPSPEDSQRVLRELAEMHAKAATLHARHDELKDLTKRAKDKCDEADAAILERIRVTTHKSDLPLFDSAEREADQARMETAGADAARQAAAEDASAIQDSVSGQKTETAQDGAQTTNDGPDAESIPPAAEVLAGEAPAGAPEILTDPDIPF